MATLPVATTGWVQRWARPQWGQPAPGRTPTRAAPGLSQPGTEPHPTSTLQESCPAAPEAQAPSSAPLLHPTQLLLPVRPVGAVMAQEHGHGTGTLRTMAGTEINSRTCSEGLFSLTADVSSTTKSGQSQQAFQLTRRICISQ